MPRLCSVAYSSIAAPIIEHYKNAGALVEIDGNDSVENIFAKIDNEISK